jgi:hypothetical protein
VFSFFEGGGVIWAILSLFFFFFMLPETDLLALILRHLFPSTNISKITSLQNSDKIEALPAFILSNPIFSSNGGKYLGWMPPPYLTSKFS